MSLKLGNNLCKHQSVIKVTRWNLKVISLRVDLLHYTPPFLSGSSYDWKIAFTVVDYRKAVIFMKVILLSKYTQVLLIISISLYNIPIFNMLTNIDKTNYMITLFTQILFNTFIITNMRLHNLY